jgi:hypothetical protein
MVGDRFSRSPAGSRPRVPVIAVVAPVSSKRTGRRGPVPATCLRKTRRCGLTFAGQGEFRRLRILQTQLLQTLPRSMSVITAFGTARTSGLPLELSGPASHIPFLLRASVRLHRRAQRDRSTLRSIRPTRATLRSLSQANRVDGGTARAAPELPPPCATAGSAGDIAAGPPEGHQSG